MSTSKRYSPEIRERAVWLVFEHEAGLSQGYLSQIESGSWTAVTEDAFGRIATALGVEPWMILEQAAGLKLD